MTVFDNDALHAMLAGIPQWSGDTTGIHRTVQAPDFRTAIAIVDDVAEAAEGANHHPDIDIRYRTLTFTLSTHSAGGVTSADVDLARTIDAVVNDHNAG
ncbi:4a-hydroxytetrahydrobiopterin dehydratase [Actinobacteria bacterium YIM 96077]|uniref:Putative pterin-4-alpha-carbinolamine dehydratase n=1 Tax=Phytoactinopolyspora halophila TaxID=1981511 RepID=A0A329QRZ9_9ACTN|nr:4a-hydroxytetrahydrobiopterin dehydratase [Phytoactinopolyspora halophila]AYY14333.1 4a-hydroxytetrahydrobiopterin dehydratase [Actinobacteria bacterium YIM 96077]RAW14876.1 4a-hydroxytetrahydrobiopterin dehydratase [Phytoactinopolyspora halophila]